MNVQGLFAGKPQPFGPRNTPSSIIKQAFECLDIGPEGALQDEQGNKKLHGGPEMALHQYSQSSYDILQTAFPVVASSFQIGSIGENISSPTMTDENVYIGDIYRIGEVLVQVSSPRAPCVKINQRYQFKNIDLFIAEQGITGWYYRVIETGKMLLGDTIELEHRLQHTVSIKRLMQIVRGKDSEQKRDASKIQALAKEWTRKLAPK